MLKNDLKTRGLRCDVRNYRGNTLPILLAMLSCPSILAAESRLNEVLITDQGQQPKSSVSIKSEALPTAVTIIDAEEIKRTNAKDFTDLLRKVPGINAYSFGQNDIGAPVKVRGFTGTGAHGGDVATYVDGVPQNFPSAAQGGPGMSDLSWLTPDMIERIEVIKGPFSALYGDQNRAGAINIVTRSRGASSLGATAGRYDFYRLNGVFAKEMPGGGSLFSTAETFHNGGYRDNSDIERLNLFAKWSRPMAGGRLGVRGNYYEADWNAPGYLRIDDLRNGVVKPSDRDPYSPPLYGEAQRYATVITYTPDGEQGLTATAFTEHYEKTRALGGGTLTRHNVQHDDREVYGGRAFYNWQFNSRGAVTAGGEARLDQGDGSNQRYENGAPTGLYNNAYGLDLLTYGVFVQGQYQVLDQLKLIGGLRHDRFDYDIENRKRPAASASVETSVSTPRLGVVYAATPSFSVFANYGEGFRSPAEREISPPGGGTLPLGSAGGSPSLGLDPPTVQGRDLGFNARLGNRWVVNGAVYSTENQDEIREDVPGSGVYVNIGDTTRDGAELDAQFFLDERWTFYGSYGYVRARIENPAVAGQELVSGQPENIYKLGADYTAPWWNGTLYANFAYERIADSPYYVGAGTTPQYAELYERWDLRLSHEKNHSRYTVYATLQPNDFASEQAGTSVDPRPSLDFGVAYTYTF